MARRIATILSLQDKMSPKLEKASKKTKDLSKEASKAKVKLGNMAVSASDKIGGLAAKTKTAVAAIGAALGVSAGAAIKTGLSEAMDLEGYKAQIETATKDTKKAAVLNRGNSGFYKKGNYIKPLFDGHDHSRTLTILKEGMRMSGPTTALILYWACFSLDGSVLSMSCCAEN